MVVHLRNEAGEALYRICLRDTDRWEMEGEPATRYSSRQVVQCILDDTRGGIVEASTNAGAQSFNSLALPPTIGEGEVPADLYFSSASTARCSASFMASCPSQRSCRATDQYLKGAV